ncbi:MAG: hypothetical protein JW814_07690 [Candidatus Krumholzibacteriota bacterium]|nr:hypothetical protein [Candidatus Krumholzibacteriota bacterium]
MTGTKQRETNSEAGDFYFGDTPMMKRKIYSVLFDGVEREIETLDSFAIKFSILANIPVTRVKHMINDSNPVIWSGPSKSKANGLLSLIVEAGGRGRIEAKKPEVEKKKASDIQVKGKKNGSILCPKCGFPAKKDDEFCQFCMSSLVEVEKTAHPVVEKAKKLYISPPRLLFYLFLLFSAIILINVIS